MNKSARLWTPTRAGFLIIAAVLAACASNADGIPAPSAIVATPGAPAPPVAKDVGATGGTVVNESGTGVEVPAGALPANVQISVTSAPDKAPPSGTSSLGTPTVFGPNGVQFAKPVTVVIAFDPAKLPAGTTASNIVVYTAPDGTSDYQPLSTVVRDGTHVAAETTHFCVLVPVIPPPTDSTTTADAGTTSGPTQSGGDDGGCKPVLCGFYGPGACGTLSDGCGGKLDCGVCTSTGADAGATSPDGGSCMPLTCSQYQGKCGTFPDGCGASIDCNSNTCSSDGSAPPPADGGGSGCFSKGCGPGMCGTFADPCFGTITCNDCDGGSAGSTDASAPASDGGTMCKTCMPGMCGTFPDDGCGNPLVCSDCDGGAADAGAATYPDGGPICKTCQPGMCGVFPDGCGGTIDCACAP